VVVVEDGVALEPLVEFHKRAVKSHNVRIYIPGLAVREVWCQDTQWLGGIRGLVEEARTQNAQALHDPVDAHDVGDGERQDAKAYERLRDGEGLIETIRRGNIPEAQG
jgi:hypothetical protein